MEEKIKEAFQKVKEDIDFLAKEMYYFKQNLDKINNKLDFLDKKIEKFSSTHNKLIPTNQQTTSTDNSYLEGLKPINLTISTGNKGVSTDRQTDRQTDQQTQKNEKNPIDNANEILDSLDNIRKEIRLKFKKLTDQEILIFSTIYQLEEEGILVDYKILSNKLNLSESSIRDYVSRLIKKGIPLDKIKINNKQIQLSISKNLKKIATLSTILRLRDL